jgi:hypothetical protein
MALQHHLEAGTVEGEMRIEVTQEDIDNGTKGRCRLCPIALAVRRATGSPDAWVDDTHIMWGASWGAWDGVAMTPRSAWSFMASFDSGQDVQPFSFEL